MRKGTTRRHKSLKCPAPSIKSGHIDMAHDAISELELIDNLESKAVKSLALVQGEDNKFRIYATLTWKEGRLLLETQRKKPRTWASLDRLVRHINSKYENVPVIHLELRSQHDHGKHHRKRGKGDQESR